MARLSYENMGDAATASAPTTAQALFELGMRYSAGRDCEPDMVVAHKWFNLAALRGNEDAKFYRMELAREMSRRQVAEAQRKAREWLKRH